MSEHCLIPFIRGTRRVTFIESANTWVDAGARRGEGGRGRWSIRIYLGQGYGCPGGSAGKESACETLVPFLGGEDPLEKGKAIHASILAWRIPWTEEPGGLQSRGSQRVGHDFHSLHSLTSAEEGAHFRRRMMVRVAQQYEHT